MFRQRRALLLAGLAALAGGLLAVEGSARPRVAPLGVAVYFVRAEHVAPLRRFVPRTGVIAAATVRALLAGPTVKERRAGYTTAVPSSTGLRTLALSQGVLTVDLTRRFESGGGSLSMQLRVAQIVYTATQFPSVQRVRFRIAGRPVRSIGGEGLLVVPPPGRAQVDAHAPAILVEQPLPLDRVRSPLIVRGSANVFEARLTVELRTASGSVLAHRELSASAGTGTRGRFATSLPTRATGRVAICAFSPSPKDGQPINTTCLPVLVTRR
jgi:hypothetical protein